MDSIKIGKLILKLRHEKGLTQKQLADMMNISDRTVSKWERSLGCPDISLLSPLADCLGVNIERLLSGESDENDITGGNMKKSKYYVCKQCSNVIISTGEAEVSCCGRKMETAEPKKADDEHTLNIEQIENDWYITTAHPMEKEHYISFVSFATAERINFVKLYPEWDMQVRMPRRGHGVLSWYCTEHGLFYKYL